MDFHGFARKELQALCKLNKIPANMTNVAMAEALSSLVHVEGLGDIIEQRTKKCVESGSPEVARTTTRTSTRGRKPPVNVLESGGVVPSSRARVRSSIKVGGGGMVEDEIKRGEKTPVVASGMKRGAGAASSRRKVEVPSVQRVYSTRRSVRLVEKQLSELCLADTVRRARRPIKIDDELSSAITCSDIKGDQVKMEDGTETELVVEEVTTSSQVSTQAADSKDIAAQGSKSLNGGITDVTTINNDKDKAISEDDARDVDGVVDNAAIDIVVEIEPPGCEFFNSGVEEEEKAVSKDCPKSVVGATDNADKLGTGIVDVVVAAVEEVVKVKSKYIVKDAVGAVANLGEVEKESDSVADEVTIEGVLKANIEDCVDVVGERGDKDNTDVENEGNGISNVAAIEEGEVLPGLGAVDAENDTPAKIAEPEFVAFEVVQSNVIADHVPDLLIEKEGDFDSAANLDNAKVESDCENAKIGTEAVVTHDEDFPAFVDTELKVTSAFGNAKIEEVVSQPALVSSPHLKGQLSANRTVIKVLVSENINKENIACIIKTEESSKAPKTQYQDMSVRRLKKTFKKLTINQETQVHEDANSLIAKQQQQQAVTPRKALQTIPANTPRKQ